ncbi:MAG: hypothetical protein ACLR8Y_10755 [Alistipes indistinctus]
MEKLSHRSRILPAETFRDRYAQIQEDAKALARHILREVIRIRREPSVAERTAWQITKNRQRHRQHLSGNRPKP